MYVRPGATYNTSPDPTLVVLCRTLDQVRTALDEGIRWIECDFEDIRKYREAVPLAREKEAAIFLAPPRIFKPGETGILRNVLGAGPDGSAASSFHVHRLGSTNLLSKTLLIGPVF